MQTTSQHRVYRLLSSGRVLDSTGSLPFIPEVVIFFLDGYHIDRREQVDILPRACHGTSRYRYKQDLRTLTWYYENDAAWYCVTLS